MLIFVFMLFINLCESQTLMFPSEKDLFWCIVFKMAHKTDLVNTGEIFFLYIGRLTCTVQLSIKS